MDEKLSEKIGEVQIADDAFLSIAGIAATDIKGVYSLSGDITRENIPHTSAKNLAKSVKITMNGDTVSVRVSVVLDGTTSIPEVTERTQAKIKETVELMTGKTVSEVSVNVTGVKA